MGYGDVIVQRIDIAGPNGDRLASSVDDFTVTGCPAMPCTLNRTLCPQSSPGCTASSTELEIVYSNNDASAQDLAELSIESTDPLNPRYVLVLSAE